MQKFLNPQMLLLNMMTTMIRIQCVTHTEADGGGESLIQIYDICSI